jgi:hypothetical protein
MAKLGSLFLLVTSMAFGQAASAEAGPSAADYAAATKLLYPNPRTPSSMNQ